MEEVTQGQFDKMVRDCEVCLVHLAKNSLQRIEGKRRVSELTVLSLRLVALRETLIQRLISIAVPAIDMVKRKEFVPAALLVRGVQETAAVLAYLPELAGKYLTDGDNDFYASEIDVLERAKRDPALTDGVQARNILTILRKVAKKYEMFDNYYESISEFCHPNFLGTSASYRTFKKDPPTIDFGPVDPDLTFYAGVVVTLTASLRVAVEQHAALTNLMPKLFPNNEFEIVRKTAA